MELKNGRWKKRNKRSCKVFSVIEEIYSRKQYMEKRKELREYKGSSSRV